MKSWLLFAERLMEEGYQVIIWEFRNMQPSGSAEAGMEQRWDLDVLDAAQVLRERSVTEIISMGASYGGSATAVAAPNIPELAGLAILSAPAFDLSIDPIGALSSVSVPAFFAVSTNDSQNAPGVYQKHVEALYEACASEEKDLHLIEGPDHGTDMITIPPDGTTGYAIPPTTEEQRQNRENLADELLRFVNSIFVDNQVDMSFQDTRYHEETSQVDPGKDGLLDILPALIVGCIVLCVIFILIWFHRKR